LPAKDNDSSFPPELQKPEFLESQADSATCEKNELGIEIKRHKQQEEQKYFIRKFPWFIDIFLYPANVQGLSMLIVLAGIPLLIMCLSILMSFLPVIGLFVSIIGALIIIVINLYVYLYLCQCMQNSAEGYVRLSVSVSEHSDLSEAFFVLLRIIGCLILFFAPALIRLYKNSEMNNIFYFLLHLYEYNQPDKIFYYLLAGGAALFPISLLSVVMHGSLCGLNPFLLIASILKTFFHYAGLILIFWAGIFAIFYIRQYITKVFTGGIFTYTVAFGVFRFIKIYLLMIVAHLLGRFYYKNSQKLNWGM